MNAQSFSSFPSLNGDEALSLSPSLFQLPPPLVLILITLKQQAEVEELAEACRRVYSVGDAVRELGFSGHPVVRKILRDHGTLAKCRGEVHAVLCHADGLTLHESAHGEFSIPDLGRSVHSGDRAVMALQQTTPTPVGSRLELIMRKAAVQHVRSQLENLQEEVILSLGPRLSVLPEVFARPLSRHVNPDPRPQLALDESMHSFNGFFFFRLLHLSPERLHVPASAARVRPSNCLINNSCLAISPLTVIRGAPPPQQEVLVRMESVGGRASPTHILDLSSLTSSELLTLRMWKLQPEARHPHPSLGPLRPSVCLGKCRHGVYIVGSWSP